MENADTAHPPAHEPATHELLQAIRTLSSQVGALQLEHTNLRQMVEGFSPSKNMHNAAKAAIASIASGLPQDVKPSSAREDENAHVAASKSSHPVASPTLPHPGPSGTPPPSVSYPTEFGRLQVRAAHYFHKGLAESTHRYLNFCNKFHLTALPALEETISLFATYLADRIKPQSIKVYLAGVRALHISHGHHSPLTNTIKLQQTLRGIERSHYLPTQQKLPITFDLLCKFYIFLDRRSPDDTVYWAAMTTAHFLFLRASEFTATDPPSPATEAPLCIQDVAIQTTLTGEEHLSLHIRKSKTDQVQQGVWLYTGHSKHTVCAVCAMKKNLKVQRNRPGSTTSSPLYTLSSGHPLTRRHLSTFLSDLVRLPGLDPRKYSGHSFRIGGATTASIAGLNDYEIKMMGRWSSDCYKRYIRSPLQLYLMVASQLAKTKDIPYQYATPYSHNT